MKATYRLQLTPDLDFARGARARAVPARARRHPPLPLAVAAGAARLDARLRRRRPDARSPTSSAARRSSARSASRGPRRSCSTSSRTTWRRPTTRTRSGAIRELRAKFFDVDAAHRQRTAASSTSATSPACASRTRRSSRRRTRRCSSSCARASSTGCAIDHPDGLATRRGTSSGCARPASSTSGSRRSSSRASSCATGRCEGTTGYEFANDVDGAVRRPGGRGAADRALRARSPASARRSRRSRSRPSSSRRTTTFEPEVEWLRAALGDDAPSLDRARSRRSASTAPTSTPRRGGSTDADRAAIAAAQLPAELAALLLLEERGHDAFVTRFQQTTPPVMAKGVEDTAFYRYIRLLALNEVGGDPGRFVALGRRLPRAATSSARGASRPPARDADARHEAQRRRARAASAR